LGLITLIVAGAACLVLQVVAPHISLTETVITLCVVLGLGVATVIETAIKVRNRFKHKSDAPPR
jgi:hypothetical protein